MNFQITISNLVLILAWSGTILASLGTLAGFIARLWWRFDLFTHFTVQYFILLVSCSLLFLILGNRVGIFFSGAFAILDLIRLLPFYVSNKYPTGFTAGEQGEVDSRRTSDVTYKALLANVLQRNNQYYKVIELIRIENPDLVVLIEVNQTWVDALDPALREYSGSHQALREDNYGLAVYSRLPISQVKTLSFCETGVPSIVAHIDWDGSPLVVIGTHPPPPKSSSESKNRNQQLAAIARYIVDQPGNKMVLGDLNISPWSPYFRGMLTNGKLVDSQRGMGVQLSWPKDNPFLRVPIDHILTSEGIRVLSRKTGAAIGSDHFPVIIEFQILTSSYDHS